jgi:predicted nucleic acid-binding Zn ribbon protein
MSHCKVNNWVTYGISIATQVTFVYAFLTVFFFVYVQEVEKKEFVSQMNLIVDDLMKDVKEDIPNLVNTQSQVSGEQAVVLINGVIDVMEEKIAIDSKSTVKDIMEQNQAVKKKAFTFLMTVIAILIIMSIFILLIGFCVHIQYQIKEAMLVVIFVGLTELTFLEIIAKNYISASPNKVKRELGIGIQKWIDVNHKL